MPSDICVKLRYESYRGVFGDIFPEINAAIRNNQIVVTCEKRVAQLKVVFKKRNYDSRDCIYELKKHN